MIAEGTREVEETPGIGRPGEQRAYETRLILRSPDYTRQMRRMLALCSPDLRSTDRPISNLIAEDGILVLFSKQNIKCWGG
jgi:hypothetical protein